MTTPSRRGRTGDPARPRSQRPWLGDLEIAVDGPATCLSLRSGDVDGRREGAGATGLYVDDRRVLHTFVLRLDGDEVVPLAAASTGAVTETCGIARNLGDPGPDPTVDVTRRRVLRGDGLDESVVVHNRGAQHVRCRLEATVAGDGADIAEVRHGVAEGRPLRAEPEGTAGEGAVWRDERHSVRVHAAGAVVRVGHEGARLEWGLTVPPGGSTEVSIGVTATRLAASEFDATSGSGSPALGRGHVVAQDTRLDRAVTVSFTDLAHLALRDPESPDDVFTAAGTPWYLTLFGRDALWTARMLLPFGTDLARGTLRALARRQGTHDDVASAQAPGKIAHEIRRGTYGTPGHLVLPSRYYGTVDATALWVCLLHDAWRWGMDPSVVGELRPNLEAALGWLERSVAESPDGFLRYVDESGTGLANQGWKDSEDSMRDASGAVAAGPVALVEAQAYAVEAARGAADLLDEVLGGDGRRWREWAAALSDRVRERFWARGPEGPRLAMALDGSGGLVDGLGSNIGHALGTGMLGSEEEAVVAAALVGEDLLGPLGIGTLSRSNPGYNPLGYHTGSVWTHDNAICMLGLARTGHGAGAARVARALVDVASMTSYRWPELHGGEPVLDRPVPYPLSCRPQAWSAAAAGALVTALLGLGADVPGGRLGLRPLAPAPFGAMRVEGLRLGRYELSVELDAAGDVVGVVGVPDSVDVTVGS